MLAPGEIKNDVLMGSDGWMFLWSGGQRQFDYLFGREVGSRNVDNFVKNIVNGKQYCTKRNIPYIHVVFPSKPVVMEEFLPADVKGKIYSLYLRNYEEIIRTSSLSNTCLYPLNTLKEANERCRVFRKCDTHNTDFGSAELTKAIISNLGWQHSPLSHLESFNKVQNGDLARMAGILPNIDERFYREIKRTTQIWDNRLALPGNTNNIIVTHNHCAATSKRLLLLGDSFAAACLTSLATFFRDILYVRSEKFQPDLVDLFQPDAVVTSNAERYLAKVHDESSAESVVMRTFGAKDYNPHHDFSRALRAQLSFGHYKNHYYKWSEEVSAFIFPSLGKGQPNDHIDLTADRDGWYTANDRDPQILFQGITFQSAKPYTLNVTIESDIDAICQLFVGRTSRPIFNEENSIRYHINAGKNTFSFNIVSNDRGGSLRLDPINRVGRFKITDLYLSEDKLSFIG